MSKFSKRSLPSGLPTKSVYVPFFFSGEGPSSRHYRRTAALRLLVQPCDDDDDDDDDDDYFLSFS
jgi:hypothetical protein